VAEVLAARRRERERLIELARGYVRGLSGRIPVVAAAVVGSVARGDFNVWSDVDVVVISDRLPPRIPDRSAILAAGAPAGVEAVGYTREEFRRALARGDPLATSAVQEGVALRGEAFLRRLADRPDT
jgi:predicted nucleotidyltransferase